MLQENELKRLRSARGWTQQQAADYFAVDKATIWRWENEGIPQRGPARMAIERELNTLADAGSASPPEAA